MHCLLCCNGYPFTSMHAIVTLVWISVVKSWKPDRNRSTACWSTSYLDTIQANYLYCPNCGAEPIWNRFALLDPSEMISPKNNMKSPLFHSFQQRKVSIQWASVQCRADSGFCLYKMCANRNRSEPCLCCFCTSTSCCIVLDKPSISMVGGAGSPTLLFLRRCCR